MTTHLGKPLTDKERNFLAAQTSCCQHHIKHHIEQQDTFDVRTKKDYEEMNEFVSYVRNIRQEAILETYNGENK